MTNEQTSPARMAQSMSDLSCWSVIFNGKVVLDEESYTVASNVAESINSGAHGISECDEVAASILRAVR